MEVGVRRLKKRMRQFCHLNFHAGGSAFHATGEVDGVPKEAVAGHGLADHPRHHRARGQPTPNQHRSAVLFPEVLDGFERRQREFRYLVDVELFDEGVEDGVQLVQHLHHLNGRHVPGHGREPNDVREENRHLFVFLNDAFPLLQLDDGPLGHHPEEEKLVFFPIHERIYDVDGEHQRAKNRENYRIAQPGHHETVSVSDCHDPLIVRHI
mmetsp:Transcript_64720/g.148197  ORF Transcript_64720/g.148197 Transcript_64720/m.148197 type:complete len:210 (+) Transcript_64720:386-1015(+)